VSRDRILRIVDANLNRAAEGLRVVEDGVRFILDEPQLTQQLKALRHQLLQGVEGLLGSGTIDLVAARDVAGDVGAASRDETWKNWRELLRANFRRVQEAERSLEEFGKLVSPDLSRHFKEARFATYRIEHELQQRACMRPSFGVYVITPPEAELFETLVARVRQAVAGGADVIQLRQKRVPDRTLLVRARRLREVIPADVIFLVNDRVDIAVASGADGVHLGGEDLPVADARRILGPRAIVGASAHTADEARAAADAGADYLGVGCIYTTTTKPDAQERQGVALIASVTGVVDVPVVAVGGITLENTPEVLAAGAAGVAVVRGVFGGDNVEEATRHFAEVIHGPQSTRAGD